MDVVSVLLNIELWVYAGYNFGLKTRVRVSQTENSLLCKMPIMSPFYWLCNDSFFLVKTWVRVWLLPAQGVLNSCNPRLSLQIGNTCCLWISTQGVLVWVSRPWFESHSGYFFDIRLL